MHVRSTLVILLVSIAAGQSAFGADVALQRWGVIASPEVREKGISDLLAANLSRGEFELVEREQLALATKELEFATILGSQDATRRLKLGQLVRADALVLLSLEPREKKSFLRLIISDCVYGARLRTEYFAYNAENVGSLVEACEKAIAETRRQFAGGIKSLIGVTQFLSKNLSHDYDHLQTAYAELLTNALNTRRGVAVLEIDEARAIAAELNLTAGELQGRVVPFFVEGDFEIAKKEAQAEPLVNLSVRLTDGGRVQRKGERKELTLSQCIDLLTIDLPPRLLQISVDDKTQPLGRERQRELFTKRATAFSELHAFKHAVALREAALLLSPDDHEQRMNLVADYVQWYTAINNENRLASTSLVGPNFSPELRLKMGVDEFERRYVAANGMTHHALELVLRRAVNAREAAHLLANISSRALYLPHLFNQQCLLKSRSLAESFYWSMVKEIPNLDGRLREGRLALLLQRGMVNQGVTSNGKIPGMDVWTPEYQQLAWQNLALQTLTFNLATAPKPGDTSSGQWKYATVPLLERFLGETAAVAIPVPKMATTIFSGEAGSFQFGIQKRSLERRDLDDFYERLRRSGHEVSEFYGRCGLLESKFAAQGTLDVSQLQEVDDLSKWLGDRYGKTAEFKPMITAYQTSFEKLRDAAQRSVNTPLSTLKKKHPLTPNPIPPFETNPRVTMRRIESLEDQANYGGIIPLEALDILWSGTQIAVMRTPNKIEPILVAENNTWFHHVVSDGENIWVATTNAGIWVVSLQGSILAKITSKEGLPEYDVHQQSMWYTYEPRPPMVSLLEKFVVLHPISCGKVLAIGSYGPHNRIWFAQLSEKVAVDRKEPGVYETRVFHVASKSTAGEDSADMLFRFYWFAEYRVPTDPRKRTLLVGRNVKKQNHTYGDRPLKIDLDRLEVSIFPRDVHMSRFDQTPKPTVDDKVYVTGMPSLYPYLPPENIKHTTENATFLKRFIAIEPTELPVANSHPLEEMVVLHTGKIWQFANLGVRDERPLSKNPVPLQHRFKFYGRSTHHGLVAWNHRDQFYQVQISPASNSNFSEWHDEYVPAAHRRSHHEAAEKIRGLGGSVDGVFETPYVIGGTNARPLARWGTYVYLSETWQGGAGDLALLAELYNITRIYFVKAAVDDRQMSHVGKIKSLEHVYFEETKVTNLGLSHFRSHPNLRYLRLEGTPTEPQFNDDAADILVSMPNLARLTLYGHGFTDRGLATLKKCPQLQHLILLDCNVTKQARETLMRELRTPSRPHLQVLSDSEQDILTNPGSY